MEKINTVKQLKILYIYTSYNLLKHWLILLSIGFIQFPQKFKQILARISHNVPAVYDVFASPIKGFAKQRPGLQKCGGVLAWE
jgi:hypothetical protein